jgi:integrase
VAALTAFLMGMRASEVTDRVVRDLDDNGKLLWIEVGKTKRSRRTLEVPALLRPYLLALAKDRAPDEQLITRGNSTRGNKHGRHWLLRHVRLLCEEAGGRPCVCTACAVCTRRSPRMPGCRRTRWRRRWATVHQR